MPSWGSLTAEAPTTVSQAVLEAGVADHPDRVYALVSGGHDSLTAMHVAYASDVIDLDGIVHINTGIGIPETRAFVRRRAAALDLDYLEIGAVERPATADSRPAPRTYRHQTDEYAAFVKRYGFPGRHDWMYRNLKEKPLQWFLSDRDDLQVALISGVRKAESERRMETVDDTGIQRKLGATWISPLVEFTGTDVRRYRRRHDLPMNPVVEVLEMSGECLCGAVGAERDELSLIRTFYPDTFRYLQTLEYDVISRVQRGEIKKDYALWGHGGHDDRELEARMSDSQMTMCADCERRESCDAWTERDTDPVTIPEAVEDVDYQPDRHGYVGSVDEAPAPRSTSTPGRAD